MGGPCARREKKRLKWTPGFRPGLKATKFDDVWGLVEASHTPNDPINLDDAQILQVL